MEPDHQPGRVFFRDRKWPEGFVFPSCERCNRASRDTENLISLITSYFDDDKSQKRYQARVESVRTNFPKVIDSLSMTSNEKRRAGKRIGWELRKGETHSGLPIVNLDTNIWMPHFKILGKKLALGLHYQCFLRPLPPTAHIYLMFSTNADLRMGHDIEEFLKAAPGLVLPTRDRLMLGDQFAIRYGCSSELKASVFVFNIQKRLIISAMVVEDPTILPRELDNGCIEKPFNWT